MRNQMSTPTTGRFSVNNLNKAAKPRSKYLEAPLSTSLVQGLSRESVFSDKQVEDALMWIAGYVQGSEKLSLTRYQCIDLVDGCIKIAQVSGTGIVHQLRPVVKELEEKI